MDPSNVAQLARDLLLVLGAGLVAGTVCRRLGVSMLVGYLLVGAMIGHGGAGWISEGNYPLEVLAEAGVLFLLFSIGIELSFESSGRLLRWLIIGGAVQMLLVAVPVALTTRLLGLAWPGAVLVGSAVAFSSTVLVFKALAEWGQTTTPHGRRAIGILLFQDIALVPLILLIPLLTGQDNPAAVYDVIKLFLKTALLVSVVIVAREAIHRWLAPWLQSLRGVELVVLFTLTVLGCFCLLAYVSDLPPLLGALAAGVALGGNRLTRQIDALILPYRETFAAVFFVSLGTLMKFDVLGSLDQAGEALAMLIAVLLLKTAGGAVALRLTGLDWRASLGTGLGLAQMGEFAFVLLAMGLSASLIEEQHRDLIMFVALGTLILTPEMLKRGLRLAEREDRPASDKTTTVMDTLRHAVVVGAGPIGRQAVSQLETMGVDVSLVDFSPVNLHAHALQGFRTIAGDATEPGTLHRAGIEQAGLVVVTVAQDAMAEAIVFTVRQMCPACKIIVRCRYQANAARIRKAGARHVISEESEAADAMVRWLREMGPKAPR